MKSAGFGKEYFRQILLALVERTTCHPLECFDPVPDEAGETSEDIIRLFRLKTVVANVKALGVKTFYRTPVDLRRYHEQEEWIQDAMVILLEQAGQFDPQRSGSFTRFILARVKQRLLDIQRALYRKHAPAEAEQQQVSTEDVFIELVDEEASSQEAQYVELEQWTRIWDCIERLPISYKLLFVLHEFDEAAFQELFEKFSDLLESGSQSTFQRRYQQRIFQAVQACVQTHYHEI